jgi:hypothetical protein
MVGYSEEQLALVIATHACHGCMTYVPFAPAAVWASVQNGICECLQALGVADVVQENRVDIESDNPADVFQKVSRWVRGHSQYTPAIDVTGGKKPMDAGAAYAASFYGIPAYYLDSTEYDRDLGLPLPHLSEYRELDLPDVVFSLQARQRIFVAYRARRFDEASELVGAVADDEKARCFLDEEDRRDLENARDLLERAKLWLHLRYEDPRLSSSLLHNFFTSVGMRRPREKVEMLLEPDNSHLLLEYLRDEYWRLTHQLDARDYREVVLGCAGLAELAIDSLFYRYARIDRAEPVSWENCDRGFPFLNCYRGKCLPFGLIQMQWSAKTGLLRTGTATVEAWAHATDEGAELRVPVPQPQQPRLAVRLCLRTDQSKPVVGFSGAQWKAVFGYPGWLSDLRNDLVHLRTPLDNPTSASRALECAGRFVELVGRLEDGCDLELDHAEDSAWLRFTQQKHWTIAGEVDLERWLRLRL